MLAVAPTIIIRFMSETMSPKRQCSHLEINSKELENLFKCHTTEDRIPHPSLTTHPKAKIIKKTIK